MMDWTDAAAAARAAKSILLVTHVSPDGDAIGSMLGLYNFFVAQGKQVVAAVDDGVPKFLQFLPSAEHVVGKLKRGKWDLMIALDASDVERMGKVGAYGLKHSKMVINIDHHPTNTQFGDIWLIDSQAVSAAELVYRWLDTMQVEMTEPVAVPLLTGLITDTLGFRTSNVTAQTLRIAQSLVEAGASLTEVMARALVHKPYSYIELWKHALPSVQLDGAIASANITQADLKAAHLNEVTDGGLVGLLISADEAMVAVVFKEHEDNSIEVSLRSKPGYDVATVAFELGGGGHRQASGATIEGPLAAARERVLKLLAKAVQEGELMIA